MPPKSDHSENVRAFEETLARVDTESQIVEHERSVDNQGLMAFLGFSTGVGMAIAAAGLAIEGPAAAAPVLAYFSYSLFKFSRSSVRELLRHQDEANSLKAALGEQAIKRTEPQPQRQAWPSRKRGEH